MTRKIYVFLVVLCSPHSHTKWTEEWGPDNPFANYCETRAATPSR
jgi:hypothetical protein